MPASYARILEAAEDRKCFVIAVADGPAVRWATTLEEVEQHFDATDPRLSLYKRNIANGFAILWVNPVAVLRQTEALDDARQVLSIAALLPASPESSFETDDVDNLLSSIKRFKAKHGTS